MEQWHFIVGFVAILTIGFMRIFYNYRKVVKIYNFVYKYRDNYRDFANSFFSGFSHVGIRSSGFDDNLYEWLTEKAIKTQGILGTFGVGLMQLGTYVAIQNYQILVHTLPLFDKNTIMKSEAKDIDNSLTRCLGIFKDRKTDLERTLLNPFIWFKIGIREVIGFPFLLVNWFGIIDNNTFSKISNNKNFSIFGGIITFVAFFGGLIAIITGWEQTLQIIRSWFN